jgi:hypothetical protein
MASFGTKSCILWPHLAQKVVFYTLLLYIKLGIDKGVLSDAVD